MSDRNNNFPASFPIARLEKRTSAKGNEYFSGFLGGARVSLIKSNEAGRDGCEIWHLMIAEGKMFPPKTSGTTSSAADTTEAAATTGRTFGSNSRARRDYAAPLPAGDRMAGPRGPLGHGVPAEYQEIPF